MLEDIWETGVSSMWVCKTKGTGSVQCFIQVHFTYLFLHVTGGNMVRAIQISGAEQERKLYAMRCGSRGSLLHVEETGPTRCREDTSPCSFLLFGRPRLWCALLRTSIPLLGLPCGDHHSTVSPPVSPQKHANVLLEVQQNQFWNIFLKKSAVPLGQKVLWQIPAPLGSKVERDCLSHSFREQEALGGSCCLSGQPTEEQKGAVAPGNKRFMNFKRESWTLVGRENTKIWGLKTGYLSQLCLIPYVFYTVIINLITY